MAPLIEAIAEQMNAGGRLIYVGAGTSGWLAALDAVELSCTFGCGPGQVIALIAGESAEACESIEWQREEDVSAVPDLLLVQPTSRDTIVGISAIGSCHFVRSALVYGRSRGARAVMIQEADSDDASSGIDYIALHSGPEILQGSTRMKAGASTKRLLNALSTAVMIRRGKVRGTSMIDLACLNEKLCNRAIRILGEIPPLEARVLLESNDWKLRDAIEWIDSNDDLLCGISTIFSGPERDC